MTVSCQNTTSEDSIEDSWPILPANHVLFQIANIFLFLSYLSVNLLYLRIVLALAGLFFAIWYLALLMHLITRAIFVLRISLDTALWNSVFMAINIYRAVQIIYKSRPIEFEDPDFEGRHI